MISESEPVYSVWLYLWEMSILLAIWFHAGTSCSNSSTTDSPTITFKWGYSPWIWWMNSIMASLTDGFHGFLTKYMFLRPGFHSTGTNPGLMAPIPSWRETNSVQERTLNGRLKYLWADIWNLGRNLGLKMNVWTRNWNIWLSDGYRRYDSK